MPEHNEHFLVTGAAGFIGGWVVEYLHLSKKAQVRAGLHRWGSAARLSRFPLDMVLCDVTQPEQIKPALDGVSHVVHCAVGSDDAIIQGTENMLAAALEAGVERFVHVSTAEVYSGREGVIDETAPLTPTGSAYGDAKIEAEKRCQAYRQRGLKVSILRPSIVYGPFSRDWNVGLAARLQSGSWGKLGEYGEGRCNLIYVTDLVRAIVLAARHPSAVDQAFNIVSPEAVTWNEYFQMFSDALGLESIEDAGSGRTQLRTAVMRPVKAAAKLAVKYFERDIRYASQRYRLARQIIRRAEKSIRTAPTPAELELFSRKVTYSADKARDLLGFTPQVSLAQGLRLTCLWLHQMGLAPQVDERRMVS
jgi:nucleoside-diphosphate-sugar epimerase